MPVVGPTLIAVGALPPKYLAEAPDEPRRIAVTLPRTAPQDEWIEQVLGSIVRPHDVLVLESAADMALGDPVLRFAERHGVLVDWIGTGLPAPIDVEVAIVDGDSPSGPRLADSYIIFPNEDPRVQGSGDTKESRTA